MSKWIVSSTSNKALFDYLNWLFKLKFIDRKLIHVINSNNYQMIIIMYISSQKLFLTIIIEKRKSIRKSN